MTNKDKLTEVLLLTKSYNLQDFKDWLHWHLDIIGFDSCHVIDNESSVDIKSICDSYGDKVTYEFVKGWPNQYVKYNEYVNTKSSAWWVLPIDDDEFLYVSDKYNNNINEFILSSEFLKNNKTHKLCIGWRNLFPKKYTVNRNNEHLILNANGWSNEASNIWQMGNRPVKTMLLTTRHYDHASIRGVNANTHNPVVIGSNERGLTLNNEYIQFNLQQKPTKGTEDLILYHYQFKSDSEWKWKCKNRKSPGGTWNKNFPNKFKNLYNYVIKEDNRMIELWQKA